MRVGAVKEVRRIMCCFIILNTESLNYTINIGEFNNLFKIDLYPRLFMSKRFTKNLIKKQNAKSLETRIVSISMGTI